MMHQGLDYTLQYFHSGLFNAAPFDATASSEWSDDHRIKDQRESHYVSNCGWWASTAEKTGR